MRLFWTIIFSESQNTKKAHLRPVLVGSKNRLDIRKERPIFDLELTWFVLVTLETDCRAILLKKPLGPWDGNDVLFYKTHSFQDMRVQS